MTHGQVKDAVLHIPEVVDAVWSSSAKWRCCRGAKNNKDKRIWIRECSKDAPVPLADQVKCARHKSEP